MPTVLIGESRLSTPFTMNYQLFGSGNTKLLFVMGLTVSLEAWENQFNYFGKLKDYTAIKQLVCVFDNRGSGLSDAPAGRYTTCEMAKDTSELLDHLHWTSDVHIVGVSMGGMISQELALLRPHTFSSITLTSTHAGRTLAPLKGAFGIPMSLIYPQGALDTLASVLFPDEYLASPAPLEFVPVCISKKNSYTMKDVFWDTAMKRSKKTRASPLRGFLGQLSAVFTHHISLDRLEKLKNSQINFLVCTGTEDNLIKPVNSIYLAKMLDCKLQVFEKVGHTLPTQ
ncbi:hypothetical protein HK099_007373, partial [Clydaea vesicula]